MHFFIINMDRATERWQHIQNQFDKFGLTPTRVSAVDGKLLNPEDTNLYKRGHYRNLNNSEIGCFLSHRKCWQHIVNGQDDYAFVFEDDVYLSNLLPQFIKSHIWHEAFDLISIEQFSPQVQIRPKPVLEKDGFSIYEIVHDNPGTGGYIVSKKMARILLEHSEPFHHLVDSYMFSPRRVITAKYGSYQINPALCTQGHRNHDFASAHHIHPSTIYHDRRIALASAYAPKGIRYFFQRLKIYTRLWIKKIGSKTINIDFKE